MNLLIDHVARTKIYPPQLRVSLAARERLLNRLRAAAYESTVTLLSAPAGSGKTTLLVSLVSGGPKPAFAWLSLDENDNDPARFLTGLLAALEHYQPHCTTRTQALLAGLDQPDLYTAFNALINDLLDHLPEPLLVILDDIHALTDQSLLKGLDYLVERAPANLHFVMAGRHAPALSLARLRARRQLAELKLEELSFTVEELREFYQKVLGLRLSAEYMQLALQHTQGWAAGVALLGSSMEQAGGVDVQQAFTPLLQQTSQYIFDFLNEEIINQGPSAARDFLLKTSILQELTAERCARLMGCEESKAGEILEDLYRRHIFITAAYPGSYRYHDLFAGFLRERLLREQPEQVKPLHRRAAEIESDPLRRVAHYARAEEWPSAAQVIETVGDALLEQGAYDMLLGCLRLLPETIRAERTLLVYYSGVCASQTWDLTGARALLEHAAVRLAEVGDQNRQGTALLNLATCLSTMGDIDGARRAVEQALTCPLKPRQAAHLLMARVWQRLSAADWQGANADLDAVLDLIAAEKDRAVPRAIVAQWHYLFSVLPGGIERMERYTRLMGGFAGDDLLHASALAQVAWTALWRGDWIAARESAGQALAVSLRYGGLLWVEVDAGMLLPLMAAAEGDLAAAEQGLQDLAGALNAPQAAGLASSWMTLFHFAEGRSYWLNDRLQEAQVAHARMQAAADHEWQGLAALRDTLQGMLLLAQEDYSTAEQVLLRCLETQNTYRFTLAVGSVSILLAYLYWRSGQVERAMAYFEPELARCEQEAAPGFLRWEGSKVIVPLLRLAITQGVHAAFARRVLQAVSAQDEGIPLPETGELLTAREADVLRLVAAGASNADIARELVISIHTVKIHVVHLIEKLNVTSRQAAAARARELGLL